MDWLDAGIIVLVTVAIVNRIKAETKLKSWLYTIISFGVGAVIYLIGLYATEIIKTILLIGLAASGIYDVYKKQ